MNIQYSPTQYTKRVVTNSMSPVEILKVAQLPDNFLVVSMSIESPYTEWKIEYHKPL